VLVEFSKENAVAPQVAGDGAGNVVIVWTQAEAMDADARVYASRWVAGGSAWGAPEPLGPDGPDAGTSIDARVAAGGGTFVAWQQIEGGWSDILADRNDGWDGPWVGVTALESDAFGDTRDAHVAVNGRGGAVVVWDDRGSSLWANRYDGASGRDWIGAEPLPVGDIGDGFVPRAGLDGAGNVLVVWSQADASTRKNLWASRYDASTNQWGEAELLEFDAAEHATSADIAVDLAGNAIVVWQQVGIRARRYDADRSSWSREEVLSGAGMDPEVAGDGGAVMVAVWRQYDSPRTRIWARDHNGGAWGPAMLVGGGDDGDARAPRVALGAGRAVAVWHQADGERQNVWANSHSVGGSAWGEAELLEFADGTAHDPQVAVTGAADAVAVWQQSDGDSTSVWASWFR